MSADHTPVLLAVGHGTRDPAGIASVRALLERVRALRPGLAVVESYAEIAEPALEDAVARLGGPVVAVPLVLGRGYHARVDIPRRIGARAVVARPLGPHALLTRALADRLREVCSGDPPEGRPGDLREVRTGDPLEARTGDAPEARPGDPPQVRTGEPPEVRTGGSSEVCAGERSEVRAGDSSEVRTGDPPGGRTGGVAGSGVSGASVGGPPAHGAARSVPCSGGPVVDAVVLGAAGTSDPAGVADVRFAAGLLGRWLGRPVAWGFAASAGPSLPGVVRELRRSGARRVAVASYLLAPGYFHRRLLDAGADLVSAPLGPHDALARLVLRRYDEAVGAAERPYPRIMLARK